MNDIQKQITALSQGELPGHEGWVQLITEASEDDQLFSRDLARTRAQERFGKQVFFRGIV